MRVVKVAPEKLTAARSAAKLSQAKAADAAGVHFTTYNRYERGHLPLTDIGKIVALAGAFGVGDFTTLLEEENGDRSDDDDEEAALTADLIRALRALIRAERKEAAA